MPMNIPRVVERGARMQARLRDARSSGSTPGSSKRSSTGRPSASRCTTPSTARAWRRPDATGTTLEDRWLDAEFQVESFVESIRGARFLAETFPVFWPEPRPGRVRGLPWDGARSSAKSTSWTVPQVREWSDIALDPLRPSLPYFPRSRADRSGARAPAGAVPGWLHRPARRSGLRRRTGATPQQLCLDTATRPSESTSGARAEAHFLEVFDHYDTILKRTGQPSVTWMGIPSFGRLHIPSCDFAALVSPRVIDEFYLPTLRKEVGP